MRAAGAVLLFALTACGGDDGGSVGGASAHDVCVSETNRLREMNGKPALAHSPELEAYADEGAMIDFGSQAHSHFTSTGGGGIAFAENECPQQGNWRLPPGGDMSALVVQCIAAFYDEGPGGGHYDNMMSNNTKLGCGIYQVDTRVTIVQDYGR